MVGLAGLHLCRGHQRSCERIVLHGGPTRIIEIILVVGTSVHIVDGHRLRGAGHTRHVVTGRTISGCDARAAYKEGKGVIVARIDKLWILLRPEYIIELDRVGQRDEIELEQDGIIGGGPCQSIELCITGKS